MSPRRGASGPVLVDITKDAQIAELDFKYPEQVDLPGWNPPTKVNHRQIAAAAKAILEADKPVLLRRRRHHQRRGLRRAARARRADQHPGRDDSDRQGRLPRLASAPRRPPRHARHEVREPGAQPGRSRDRRRHSLRRSRDRQRGRLRAQRQGHPLRGRRGRDRQDPRGSDPDLRAAQAGAGAAVARAAQGDPGGPRGPDRLAQPDRRVEGRVPAPLRARAP